MIYNVLCHRCPWDSGQCEACSAGIRFIPQQTNLAQGSLVVTNLLAHTNYSFWVEAVNGVSELSLEPPRFAAVNITTNQAGRRWPLSGRFHLLFCSGAPATELPHERGLFGIAVVKADSMDPGPACP